MTRNGILVSVTLLFVTIGNLSAKDELAITELYGQAVHAYFSGDYEESHKHLSEAVDLGTDDPRVYYFRGLAKLKLGREKEAQDDFGQGGKLEASGPAQFYPIGRSLERVQGKERMAIEKVRKQARIAIRLRQKKIEQARIEEFKRDERLRKEAAQVQLGNPADNSASEEDPFAPGGAAASNSPSAKPAPATQPAPNKQPAAKSGDDPFAAPAKTAPAKPAPNNDDPFAAPSQPSKKTEPAGNDPFAAPKKDDKSGSNADPFAEPEKKSNDTSGGGADDDPFK